MRRPSTFAVLCCALCGCESIIGADFGDGKPLRAEGGAPSGGGGSASEPDAGGIAGSATGGAGGDPDPGPCVPSVAPERPDIPLASGDLEVVLVMSTIDYGDQVDADGRPAYLDVGYDVDGLCTAPGRDGAGCVSPDWLTLELEDGSAGEDNAVGKLLLSQDGFFGTSLINSVQLNENVAAGVDAPVGVLRIRGFAGLGEDDQVEVDWFIVAPFGAAPSFTDADTWTAVDATVDDPNAAIADTVSQFRAADAFVTQRLLVARFPDAVIPLLNVNFDVHDVVLTGTLVRDLATGIWSIEDGMISGSSTGNDLLRVIPRIAEASFGVSLCSDDAANYPQIKTFVCSSADLPQVGADPDSPCLRTSVGARFATAPATLGGVGPGPDQGSLCPPPTDPANDTCTEPP